jgi:hypothetical protein
MMEITASQFVRHFGQYQDEAIRGPVVVKSHDRVVGAFLSPADYAAFARMRQASRQAHRAGELPAEARAALDAATYPSEDDLSALGL